MLFAVSFVLLRVAFVTSTHFPVFIVIAGFVPEVAIAVAIVEGVVIRVIRIVVARPFHVAGGVSVFLMIYDGDTSTATT
jgi:hypothetical protein